MSEPRPTDRDFFRRIAQLPEGKRALLAQRLGRGGHSTALAETAATPNSGRLVAYVVSRNGQGTSSDELRTFATECLPEFMVPQTFIQLNELPRTPGGKVDRRSLQYLERLAPPDEDLGCVAPRNETEQILARIWADVLGLDQIGIHDNFMEVGGDSLLSIRILARAHQEGLRISPEKFFAHPTIAEQAAIAGDVTRVRAETGLVTGPAPLTPIQHWFFERTPVDPQHWNQSYLFTVSQDLDYSVLERAVQYLLLQHDALRLRFSCEDGQWSQSIGDLGENLPVTRIDLSSSPEAHHAEIIAAAATRLNESFNLAQGPLLQVALLEADAAIPKRLLMVVHHLAVDAISWGILLEDLETVCTQLMRAETVRLPIKTTSFKTWASRLVEYAQSEALQREVSYWTAQPPEPAFELPLDFDAEPDANWVASASTLSVSLDAEETRELLHDMPQAFHTQVEDALLTALARALTKWAGRSSVLVDLEGHGREALFDDVDVSRTVGWFTSVFPVWLKAADSAAPGNALKAVKDQLRTIPRRGIGHGLLLELSQDPLVCRALRDLPRAQVCFNYLGQLDQLLAKSHLLRFGRENAGPARSPRGLRAYLLEVNAWIADDRLRSEWTYSSRFHRPETIEAVAADFLETLRALIACCRSPASDLHTPSDFPLADLDETGLQRLSQMIDEIDDGDESSG